jgi:hypothetical protein
MSPCIRQGNTSTWLIFRLEALVPGFSSAQPQAR